MARAPEKNLHNIPLLVGRGYPPNYTLLDVVGNFSFYI